MSNKPKTSNGLMFQVLRTEQVLAQLRKTIAPFRQLSPKIVMALGHTGERTPEQFDAAEDCLKKAYCMLVDVQYFLSSYDDPDNQDDDMTDDEVTDTTTPNSEEDEHECE
jgi:hypothetical protein